jgi:hypothetical protein
MRCRNCGREFDNAWGICPYCGEFSSDFEESFSNIAKMFGGKAVVKQEGDSFIVILEIQGRRQAFRITPLDLEDIHYVPTEPSLPPEPQRKRVFDRTKELETEVNYVGDVLYIKASAPSVPEEDFEIDKLESSIELRAYKGKTRYFKLIPIPDNYRLVSKEVLPGEVFITLRKE